MACPILAQNQPEEHKKVLLLMGSRFEITAVSPDEVLAWHAIETAIKEIQRIEKLISSWDPNSQTSEVNRNAGVKPVQVDKELFELVIRAKKVSELTEGAFDISYASMDRIWKFDGSMTAIPLPEEVKASVAKIDYHNIVLDKKNQTIFLKEKGMKMGFGGIGKGYAANKARNLMEEMGISNGVVNAGGDLITWGKDEKGADWKIGIANPKNKDKILSWLTISNMSVVTSGNYERFFMVEGKRYSHIIDPRSGYPVQGLKSVTIVCPDAELSDALATSVFVLGKEKGLELINRMKGVDCLIIDDKDELISSNNLELNYYSESDVDQNTHSLEIGGKNEN